MTLYSRNRNARLDARACRIYACFACGNPKAKGFAQVIIQPRLAEYALFDKNGLILNGESPTWGLECVHTVRMSVILCKPCTKRLAARLERVICN